MFEESNRPILVRDEDIRYYCKVYTYPDGTQDLIAASKPLFREKGWEPSKAKQEAQSAEESAQRAPDAARRAENEARSMRRARAKVRRLALANDFKWFVTLTLDPEKVDRMDGAAVVKKLNVWCSNAVQRQGLRYILVPERHKKGGIHFHGFFNAPHSCHIQQRAINGIPPRVHLPPLHPRETVPNICPCDFPLVHFYTPFTPAIRAPGTSIDHARAPKLSSSSPALMSTSFSVGSTREPPE